MTMKSAMTILIGLAVLLGCYVTGDNALAASRELTPNYSSDLIPRRAAEKSQPMAVHPEAMVSHVVVKFAESSRTRFRSLPRPRYSLTLMAGLGVCSLTSRKPNSIGTRTSFRAVHVMS
jgi:hypothetical protein